MNQTMEKSILNNKLLNNVVNDITVTDEYLLNSDNNRLTIYPIKDNDIWQAYLTQLAAFWTPSEIDFSKDYDDFEYKLNDNEKLFVKMVLAFFSQADAIVNINLGERFLKDVKIREAIVCYDYQKMMENIHCVSGETKILTDKGYYKIEKLLNQKTKVWNGKEFSETVIQYTGDSELYEIVLSNNMTLKCTPEHKWFINNNTKNKKIVFTKNLMKDDKIYDYNLPLLDIKDPDEDKNYNLKNNKKYFVPINYSIATKLKWLENLINMYGCYSSENNTINIVHCKINFLRKIQLLLNTLTINPTIESFKKNIDDEKTYILYLTSNDIYTIYDLGFRCELITNNRQIIMNNKKNNNLITIKKIKLLKGIHKTFCFNEKKEHSGIFNGILTGQSETYSLQIENIIKDPNEKNKLLKAIENYDCIAEKANWAVKWIESEENYAHRLVAFAIMEGIFFSGSFCAIYWLKKKNLMPGLCASNELISRDEGMHMNFAVLLYSKLKHKLTEKEIHNMFIGAVDIETKFICESLPCSLLGMNSDLMTQYIKYVADRLLVNLGYNKIWNLTCPFDFMESLSLEGKKNFFEGRPTQYQKASVLNKTKDNIFDFNKSF